MAAWYIANLEPQQLAEHITAFGEEVDTFWILLVSLNVKDPAFAQLVARELCRAKPLRTRQAVGIIEDSE